MTHWDLGSNWAPTGSRGMNEKKSGCLPQEADSTLERAPTTPAPLGEAFPSNKDCEDLAGTPHLDAGKLLKRFPPNNCILSCTSAVHAVFFVCFPKSFVILEEESNFCVSSTLLRCSLHLTVFFQYQLPSPTIFFFSVHLCYCKRHLYFLSSLLHRP